MGSWSQDIRYGCRMLLKAPGFTAVAVATLALGIGANTAILSVGRSVLYRSFPFPQPNRLAVLWTRNVKRGWAEMQTSVPDILDYQNRASSLQGISGFTWTDYQTFSIGGSGGAQRVRGVAVLPGLFDVIGVRPIIGRDFVHEEYAGKSRVALLGYDLWRTKFDADRNIVGHTVRINRDAYTVVGILPKGFEVPVLNNGLEVLVPFRMDGEEAIDRKQRLIVGVGRLKPGTTVEQAHVELESIGTQLAKQYPDDADYTANVLTLRESEGLQDARTQLPIFLTTVLMMMLIAAANVAAILLSRFAARTNELVVRSALGASRGRLIRQLVTESVMLATVAGVLAVLVAEWAGAVLLRYQPFYMPYKPERVVNATAIVVIAFLSLGIGLIFGLFPALTVAHRNLHARMAHANTRVGSGWHDRLRNGLVLAEVAISIALIVGAGLMARTMIRIAHTQIGFDPHGLALGRVSLDGTQYPSDANRIGFYDRLIERLRSQPGVVAATAISHFCTYDPTGWCMGSPVRVPGQPGSENKMAGMQEAVMPGYFAAMGMPILRGRDFTDNEAEPAIIVDENFVRTFFPHENPIGKQVELLPAVMRGDEALRPGLRMIVGVVPAVQRVAYWTKPFPQAYVPYRQNPVPAMYAVVRTRDGGGAAAIRKAVAELDADLPVFWSATMDEWVDKFYASQRFELLALGTFAFVAVLISASGPYAVISQRVAQRTREIGIRLALGAKRRDLEYVVVRQAAVVVLAGTVVGLIASLALGRVLANLVYGVGAHDPLTLACGASLVVIVSGVAAYLPARRAAKSDPLVALRSE